MIIVEGFDASGKSTLAKRIGDVLGWPVLHTGGPTTDEADVVSCLHRSMQRAQKKVVQDRITHISESVYSMTANPGKAALALNAIREIPTTVTLIYCRPPTDVMVSALEREHIRKGYDTPKHMAMITRDAATMIAFYDTVMAMASHRIKPIMIHNRCDPLSEQRIVNHITQRYT